MIKAVYAAKLRLRGKIDEFLVFMDSESELASDDILLRIWVETINFVFKIYQSVKN